MAIEIVQAVQKVVKIPNKRATPDKDTSFVWCLALCCLESSMNPTEKKDSIKLKSRENTTLKGVK